MRTLFERKTGWLLFFLLIFVLCSTATAQKTRAELVQVTNEQGKTEEITLYDGSYALVIGESDYTNGWDKLPGVKTDVAAVKTVLEKQGFLVNVVMNPKSKELTAAIESFIDDYGYIYGNRLLIYFAGHGHTGKTADGRDMGYIIPSDTPIPDESNKIDFQRKAVSMETIQAYAKKIQAKHALFVFDSCFSGKLVNKGGTAIPPFIMENVEKPVRQFITSGSASQTVPDDSIFRKLFILGVEGAADEDNDGYILGSELGKYIKRELTNDSKRNQTPQYGEILDVDLKQGDFVFVSAKPKRNPVKSPKIPLPQQSIRNITPQSQNFSVSAFTKTDVCAEAGTRISITADGSISLGPNIRETNPAGKDSFKTFLGLSVPIDKQYYIEPNFPLGALMCRFDYSSKWEYCSTSRTMTAEKKGCLTFEVNDNDKTDNNGTYRVAVKPL